MNDRGIVIQGLNKFYGKKQVLYNINLTIDHGMFGLLGRNGAGKTTLMKTIATLLNKKSGKIEVCGVSVDSPKEIRKIIGYLPQDFSMYPSMSILEVMDYLGVLSGLSTAQRKQRSEMLLTRVNLIKHKNKKVKELSGGMKRRLGIAQALLNDPKVLIVDEPTAGLDPEERIRFRNLLCDVAQDRIVILSTHIVGDIEATCENIAILNDGKLLYNGTVDDILDTAKGKVFTKAVSKVQLPVVKKEYEITSMHTQGSKTHIRFLSDTPVSDAEVCEPNIEDAYMFLLHKSGAKIELSSADTEDGGE